MPYNEYLIADAYKYTTKGKRIYSFNAQRFTL